MHDDSWTRDDRDILSTKSLSDAAVALQSGWLCGMHYYYGGGRGGDAVVFRSFQSYLQYVQNSRPGDLFLMWSVNSLRGSADLLLDYRCGDSPSKLEAQRSRLSKYLETPGSEVLACAGLAGGTSFAVLTDEGGSNSERLDDIVSLAVAGVADAYAIAFSTLDAERRYFLSGKRPDASGAVPLGGAY